MPKQLRFEMERETKNTIRFNEKVGEMESPSIGVLYVQKHALKELGLKTGDDLIVELRAVWEE